MARRRNQRSRIGMLLTLSVLVLACYGGWVIWHKKDVQKNVNKIEKVVKAAKHAW